MNSKSQKTKSDFTEPKRNVLAFPLGGFIPRRWTEFGLCFNCEASCELDEMLCDRCRHRMGELLRKDDPDGAA